MGPRARIAAVIGAIALAAWIGHRSARQSTPTAPLAQVSADSAAAPPASTPPMRAPTRPVVIVHTPAARVATEPVPQDPALPTAEQVDAADTARAILDAAIARGAWTENDWAGLDAILGAMTLEQRDQALRDLSGAVNEGRMTMVPRSVGS
jgi:predicted lipid-binding transport protein (Tim44 family)